MKVVVPGQPHAWERAGLHKCPRCKCRLPPPYDPPKNKEAKRGIATAWRAQHQPPMQGELAMKATFHRGTRHRADASNLGKLAEDALNKVAYDDDYQLVDVWFSRRYDKENPRTELEIVSVSEAKSLYSIHLDRM